jgi:hypothetical protein
MQPVTQIVRAVAADRAVRRRLDVHAVAHVADVVVEQREPVRVPDVNAGSLLAGGLALDAVDARVLDPRAVGLPEVDPEQRIADDAAANRGARRRDVNPRCVLAEIPAAAAVDFDPLDHGVGRGDRDDGSRPRPPDHDMSVPDEAERTIDDQIPVVHARGHVNRLAGGGEIDPRLEQRARRGASRRWHGRQTHQRGEPVEASAGHGRFA